MGRMLTTFLLMIAIICSCGSFVHLDAAPFGTTSSRFDISFLTIGLAAALASQYIVTDIYRAIGKPISSTFFSGGLSGLILVCLIVVALLSQATFTFVDYARVHIAAVLIQNIIARKVFKDTIEKRINPPIFKQYARLLSGIPFMLTNLSTWALQQGTILIIILGGQANDAALFTAAARYAMVIQIIGSLFYVKLLPDIIRLRQTTDTITISRKIRNNSILASAFCLAPAIPVLFYGRPIFRFIFGYGYEDAAIICIFMLLAAIWNVSTAQRGILLQHLGHERYQLGISVIFAVVSLIVGLIVFLMSGLVACVLVVSLISMFQVSVESIVLKRMTGISVLSLGWRSN